MPLKVIGYLSPLLSSKRRTYVNVDQFDKNIRSLMMRLCENNQSVKIYFIGISMKPDRLERKRPGYNLLTQQYNDRLIRIFDENFIDLNLLVPDVDQHLISDGVHLTSLAHRRLYTDISQRFKMFQ